MIRSKIIKKESVVWKAVQSWNSQKNDFGFVSSTVEVITVQVLN